MVNDVAPDDRITEKPRVAFPTFGEWISDGNAEQVIVSGSRNGAGGSTTIYSVPNNFTLFITSANISSDNTSGGAGDTESLWRIGGGPVITRIVHDQNTSDHLGFSMVFPMPLKIVSGGTLVISNSTGTINTAVSFQGFILPKKISIR